MKTDKVTIKDIANAAGVSIGTVDRVLHNRGEVAQHTRDNILRIASQLNYRAAELPRSEVEAIRIVAIMPMVDSENNFWACHREGIEQQAAQISDRRVDLNIITYSIHDEADFRIKSHNVVEMKPDGVIIAPTFSTESLDFTRELDRLNIPYIFIDTMIDNTNPISFIGEDAFQSGRVAASVVDFGIPVERDILMVNIAKNIGNRQHLNARNQGFLSYFMDKGRNTGLKISVEIPETEYAIVEQKMEKVLQNANVGAIWVSGSRSYMVARYLEKINRRDIILVGYDVYDQNIEYLKRDIIQFLIAQQPREQGRRSLRAIVDFIAYGRRPMQTEYQKVEIVNSESLRFFYN